MKNHGDSHEQQLQRLEEQTRALAEAIAEYSRSLGPPEPPPPAEERARVRWGLLAGAALPAALPLPLWHRISQHPVRVTAGTVAAGTVLVAVMLMQPGPHGGEAISDPPVPTEPVAPQPTPQRPSTQPLPESTSPVAATRRDSRASEPRASDAGRGAAPAPTRPPRPEPMPPAATGPGPTSEPANPPLGGDESDEATPAPSPSCLEVSVNVAGLRALCAQ